MKSILIKLKGHPHVQKGTAYTILFAMGFCHLLNDMIQSVIPAMYPVLKDNFGFTFAQIGIITLVFQLTSSVFQPFVGQYADRRPQPYSLSAGMCFTLTGLLLLAFASNFFLILLAVAIIGCGSSVFHPEASRVAQIASGGRKSLAQSIFQVGGNGGSAIGPLLAALIIIPYGQHAVGWFSIAALLASAILVRVGYWYKLTLSQTGMSHRAQQTTSCNLSKKAIRNALIILVIMLFSKYFFISCMTSYFTFFLIEKFGITVQQSQPICFSRGTGHRDFARRVPRRPVRTKIRHSLFYPRCSPLHTRTAIPQSVLDARHNRYHRFYHRIGLFCHTGLCYRFKAG